MNFESRDGEVTWLGQETSGDGTTTVAVGSALNTHPFAYGCSEGTTIVAGVDRFGRLTAEKAGATFGGSAVSDRALLTAATAWASASDAESVYQLRFGPISAPCSTPALGLEEGVTTSGNTFEVCDPVTGICTDYYYFYILSSKYAGELRIADENIKYALPVGIRSQFMDSPGFLGEEYHTVHKSIKDATGGTEPENCSQKYTGGVKYREIQEEFYRCGLYEGDVKIDAGNSPLYGTFATGDLAYDQRDVSPCGNTFAGKDNQLSVTFTPYTEKAMFIKIPLVSRSYPNNSY